MQKQKLLHMTYIYLPVFSFSIADSFPHRQFILSHLQHNNYPYLTFKMLDPQ